MSTTWAEAEVEEVNRRLAPEHAVCRQEIKRLQDERNRLASCVADMWEELRQLRKEKPECTATNVTPSST